jgi:hypothetical protein
MSASVSKGGSVPTSVPGSLTPGRLPPAPRMQIFPEFGRWGGGQRASLPTNVEGSFLLADKGRCPPVTADCVDLGSF